MAIVPEEVALGTVDWRVYWRYYTAGAGKLLLFCFFLLMVGAQVSWIQKFGYNSKRTHSVCT